MWNHHHIPHDIVDFRNQFGGQVLKICFQYERMNVLDIIQLWYSLPIWVFLSSKTGLLHLVWTSDILIHGNHYIGFQCFLSMNFSIRDLVFSSINNLLCLLQQGYRRNGHNDSLTTLEQYLFICNFLAPYYIIIFVDSTIPFIWWDPTPQYE